ncbi:hypothetical protein [Streptomyces sp. NBC_00057]|uniref:hypothetical protein n=1 Tax=Streptomyces sp. NBC_00057 TaxID=2975634 RepID=UPI003254DFEC
MYSPPSDPQAFAVLGGHRPALLAIHDTEADGTAYRTELSERLDQPVISTDPILRHQPELPDGWWPALEGALEKVTAATTDRVADRQAYIDRAVSTWIHRLDVCG